MAFAACYTRVKSKKVENINARHCPHSTATVIACSNSAWSYITLLFLSVVQGNISVGEIYIASQRNVSQYCQILKESKAEFSLYACGKVTQFYQNDKNTRYIWDIEKGCFCYYCLFVNRQ